MDKKGKQARTRADAYTQKWCVCFACALVAYLCTALHCNLSTVCNLLKRVLVYDYM